MRQSRQEKIIIPAAIVVLAAACGTLYLYRELFHRPTVTAAATAITATTSDAATSSSPPPLPVGETIVPVPAPSTTPSDSLKEVPLIPAEVAVSSTTESAVSATTPTADTDEEEDCL